MVIQHSQLSSVVIKRFSSVQTFAANADEIVKTVIELDAKLNEWKNSISDVLRLDYPIHSSSLRNGISLDQALCLQFQYYGTLFDIHSVLTCPWFKGIFCADQHPTLQSQSVLSSEMVAEGARTMIRATQHIHINAASPVMQVHLCPMLPIFFISTPPSNSLL